MLIIQDESLSCEDDCRVADGPLCLYSNIGDCQEQGRSWTGKKLPKIFQERLHVLIVM